MDEVNRQRTEYRKLRNWRLGERGGAMQDRWGRFFDWLWNWGWPQTGGSWTPPDRPPRPNSKQAQTARVDAALARWNAMHGGEAEAPPQPLALKPDKLAERVERKTRRKNSGGVGIRLADPAKVLTSEQDDQPSPKPQDLDNLPGAHPNSRATWSGKYRPPPALPVIPAPPATRERKVFTLPPPPGRNTTTPLKEEQ